MTSRLDEVEIAGLCVTCTGGRIVGASLGVPSENDFTALADGVETLFPDVRTVLELGGESAWYAFLDRST